MADDRNPQAEQMAHESMVRNLAAQMEAIWPQERELVRARGLSAEARVLDVGCGTGEFLLRVAEELPEARLLGVDVHPPHVELARERCAGLGERVEVRLGDAFELKAPDGHFDLAACRHLLQAVPDPERVLAEMRRVTRPGAWLHLVAEDYAMLHFDSPGVDVDRFFLDGPAEFARRTGSDLRSGRRMFRALRSLGLENVRVDYLVLDTVRVPRETLTSIFTAWRDGYSAGIVANSELSPQAVAAAFEAMLACLRDPDGYAVWQVPVVSGRVPG